MAGFHAAPAEWQAGKPDIDFGSISRRRWPGRWRWGRRAILGWGGLRMKIDLRM